MKHFKNLTLVIAAVGMLLFTSCGNDDDFVTNPDIDPVNFELNGTQEGDRILDPSQGYTLTGSYIVKSGATLTIPAGTQIISQVASNNYIAIEKGAEIDVQGTENLPVVMKSSAGNQGDWGGLVILGDALTTEGVNATAEVGGFVYGGTNASDSSGNIDYLIIKNAGAQINADSQYNGLTLYAVGSGTSINNVALLDGADDGVEFFGGSVSITNLYAENNQDDSVDWTEGWNGTLTNTYVAHNNDGFSTAIEADGDNNNPTIINFTAISSVGGTALQFKKMSGATMTNVFLAGYDTNVDMKDEGPIENIIVDGEAMTDASNNVFNGTAVDISNWGWVQQ
jgi:hypothetical protein